MGELTDKLFRSFRTKVMTPVVSIMAALVFLTAWLVHERVKAQFRANASRDLAIAEAVFQNSQAIRTRNLLQRFRVLPNEPRYKAVFQTEDPPTLRELLKDLLAEHQLDVATYIAAQGSSLAHAKRDPTLAVSAFEQASARATTRALAGEECVDIVSVGEKLYDVISVAVEGMGGAQLGALTIGSEIGLAVAQEFSLLTHSHIALLAKQRVIASTLPAQAIQAHLQHLAGARLVDLVLDGEHFYASEGQFRSLTQDHPPSYILLSSYEQPLRALRATQQVIFIVSFLGILLGGAVVWFFVRRVAKPLEQLYDSVDAVGRGDFSRRIEVKSDDECGQLAIVFNRMVENLTKSRQQLEQTLTTLKTTQSQLIQSEKLSGIGEFVAGVAHELNNPLTAVMGFAELLKQANAEPKTRHQLDLIYKSATRCHKIVHSLLSFARRHQPERKQVSLNDLIEASVEFLQYQMRTSNIDVRLALDPAGPQALADPHQLQQVLINLLNNARQAIQDHQPQGWIQVSSQVLDQRVLLKVQDNGPGIPREHLAKIFNPFFTTKGIGKGTGLGLSLCYGIIKEHGGNISVDSPEGQGATFLIDLPVSTAPPSPEVASDTKPTAFLRKTGRGRRVLIIDDEEAILDMLRELLVVSGFEVDTATDGQTGLQRLQEHDYDAILCDWKMPGLNGRQVYEALRDLDAGQAERMIFMTGDVVNETTQKFLAEQGCPALAKPFTLREFRDTFEQVLNAA